eukprot:TRINITY_DN206_c0_g2_i5.p2 TRINITY_DN206_c0_g2~~TRINITY_DN206_c0_g2_i5.p2  ORF type:complete len:203 (+),score=51.44 TRINITY_DN206_c0_g2_i5:24-611(+)
MVGKSGIDSHTWDVAEGVKNWYCQEEGCYNYNSPGYSGSTGHFTAVVWKASTEIGCAVCHIPDQWYNKVYLMCNYKEAGNFQGRFPENVLSPDTAPSGCAGAPPSEDECGTTPCGTDQTCNDPDQTNSGDYTCTCKSDTSIVATGQGATCTKDECDDKPCGDDQTCNDPDTGAKTLHDYVCTCKDDTSVKQTDGQ